MILEPPDILPDEYERRRMEYIRSKRHVFKASKLTGPGSGWNRGPSPRLVTNGICQPISTRELAHRKGVALNTVYNWIRSGRYRYAN